MHILCYIFSRIKKNKRKCSQYYMAYNKYEHCTERTTLQVSKNLDIDSNLKIYV